MSSRGVAANSKRESLEKGNLCDRDLSYVIMFVCFVGFQ